MCWCNVHSACSCKIPEQGVRSIIHIMISNVEVCFFMRVSQTVHETRSLVEWGIWMCKLTWPSRGCSLQGPWSSNPLPQFPHRLFLTSGRIWRVTMQRDRSVCCNIISTECVTWYDTNQKTHLIRSVFPSSLPLCSSPLVQANTLAMGLVLVGLPCRATVNVSYWKFNIWSGCFAFRSVEVTMDGDNCISACF